MLRVLISYTRQLYQQRCSASLPKPVKQATDRALEHVHGEGVLQLLPPDHHPPMAAVLQHRLHQVQLRVHPEDSVTHREVDHQASGVLQLQRRAGSQATYKLILRYVPLTPAVKPV